MTNERNERNSQEQAVRPDQVAFAQVVVSAGLELDLMDGNPDADARLLEAIENHGKEEDR